MMMMMMMYLSVFGRLIIIPCYIAFGFALILAFFSSGRNIAISRQPPNRELHPTEPSLLYSSNTQMRRT